MDGSNAWADILATYQQVDGPAGLTFLDSFHNTIHSQEDLHCDELGPDSNCEQTVTCAAFPSTGQGDSGSVGVEIYNSFVVIRDVSAASSLIVRPNHFSL